jgi:hypothetical protein
MISTTKMSFIQINLAVNFYLVFKKINFLCHLVYIFYYQQLHVNIYFLKNP